MKNTSLARNHNNHSTNECSAVNKGNYQIGIVGNNICKFDNQPGIAKSLLVQDMSRLMFFRFQQKKKQSDVELVTDGDGETSLAPPAEATPKAPAAHYKSPFRHGPGQPYILTGAMLLGFGMAAIIISIVYFVCHGLLGWDAALLGWTRLLGNLALLGIAGGVMCIPLGVFYQLIGLIFSRHEPRPGDIPSYVVAGVPWALFLLITSVTPGYIGPFLNVAYPLVIGAYLLNLFGLYRMLRAKSLGIWCLWYLITLPCLFLLLLGPAALTIWQALAPVFSK